MTHRCEALLECQPNQDMQCKETAICQVRGDRWVCWVHGARISQDSSVHPVRFIIRPTDLANPISEHRR